MRPDETNADKVEPSGSPAIRKSCHFCRSRKIRCSGQRMCTACSARNLDCVYGREASKGRPRGSTTSSAKSVSSKDSKSASHDLSQDLTGRNDSTTSFFAASLRSKQQSRDNSPPLSSSLSLRTYGSPVVQEELISTKLERSFHQSFPIPPPQDSTLGSTCFSQETERTIWEAAINENSIPEFLSNSGISTATPGTFTYQSLFYALVPGLVELVSARFGSLGFCQSDNSLTQYFAACLSSDRVSTMFDAEATVESPPKYNDHQIYQLIELWFFHHPLSFILSKTLLLHSYRSGNHDEILLVTMLAGASYAFNGGSNHGEKLFQWAQSRLCQRRAGSLSLASIQSLILVGWHELCLLRARRGHCFLKMARTGIIEYHVHLNETPRTEIDWINGVDVGEVELELSQRIYWLTFALELWAALQKDVPFLHPMPPGLEVKFPPLEEASSAVLTLDKDSGNIATLGAQEKAMRELWPLSHIASTIESMYALYPRQAAAVAEFPACGWVSQTLPRLRHLLDKPSNISDVCQKIREILSDGLEKSRAGMGKHPSEIFTLAVYRILIIHLLFPRPPTADTAPLITDAILNDTIRFVTAFKDALQSLNQATVVNNVIIESSESNDAQTLVLGLDTCSRALYQLYALSKASSPIIQEEFMGRQVELVELARNLHIISKHPKLRSVPTLSTVKKSLKWLKTCFEQHSSGQTSQLFENDPWAARLSIVGTSHTAMSDSQLLPVMGNTGFEIQPDPASDGSTVDWTEEEWIARMGFQSSIPMTLPGVTPC